jgi:uncharacterized protein (DUF2147 family)
MNQTMKKSFAILFGIACGLQAQTDESTRPFQGRWITEDRKGVYDAAPCAQGFCGTIIGVKPHIDDKGKASASCGVQVLTLTKWNPEKKRWEGQVMDPDSKKNYTASLELGKDGNPVMRASWGIVKFSEKWTKFSGTIGNGCEIK